jgi:ATP-binding cassette subfamily B protein
MAETEGRFRKTGKATWTLNLEKDNYAGISEAVEVLTDEVRKHVSNPKLISTRLTFCEELLIDYAECGYTEAKLVFREIFKHYSLRIVIPGDSREPLGFVVDKERDQGEDEIRKSIHSLILKNANGWVEYSYARGANIFDIPLSGTDESFGERVLELYEKEGQEIAQKPSRGLIKIVGLNSVKAVLAVINRIVKRAALMMVPVCTAAIIDSVVGGGEFFSVKPLTYVAISFLLILINCICTYKFEYILMNKTLREIESGLKSAVLKKLEFMSMSFMNKTPSGGIFSKIIKDTEGVRKMLNRVMETLVQLFTDLTVILIMTIIDCPQMLIFYAITVPIAVFLMSKFNKPVRFFAEKERKTNEQANGVIRDMQAMWQTTRLHGVNHTEYNMLEYQLQRVRRAGNETDYINHKFQTASSMTFQMFQLICLIMAVYLASKNIVSIGMVVMFRAYFENLVTSVEKFIESLPELTQGYESFRSLNEILCSDDVEPDGTKAFTRSIEGEIEFKDVVFSYPGAEQPVLDHVSFKIPAGKSVAFIGKSGSGKTTIMNLLTGLLQKDSGEILIDGVEIDDIKKNSFRRQIAVVPQKTTLFAGSLWDNLVYGQAMVTYDEVCEVIKQIGLDEFVDSLPGGLDAEVRELGANFSGGQQQRIAIARALLRKPRLLLFDEATSALDSESEEQVKKAIDAMMGQCTMVMIAHRMATIRKCDLIFKLSPGGGMKVYNGYDEMMKDETA